ncbi:MAG: thymidine phosphorylase [Anaerolineae bacterium]|nr:thymidine phosphorylase [Anaerolineae bacterium]
MRAVDIIARKRDGFELTTEEIAYFIEHFTSGDIPDYQASALLMAIVLRGMTRPETAALTLAMAHSGDTLDLSDITDYAVDKHSSGGVGDKTSLVVLPLVAAFGVPVAKMSGRGLGYSGGTLDKLEAIRGYRVHLTGEEFRDLAKRNGFVLAGQSLSLAPADGKLYALRDVTATVPSLPLIASSIMSKKLAAGARGLVLDVKAGSGAFMATVEDARQLAQAMVDIGVDAGRDVIALLSDMNQPLGHAVGNALEVAESIYTLRGEGPADFTTHSLAVAEAMLRLAGRGVKWTDPAQTRAELEARLHDGSALAVFRKLVEAQGGDTAMVDDPALLPTAAIIEGVTAPAGGVVQGVDAFGVARAAFDLGAGREKKTDDIDPAVGVQVFVKVGETVRVGQKIAEIHANAAARVEGARAELLRAISLGTTPHDPLPLFYGEIEGYGSTARH